MSREKQIEEMAYEIETRTGYLKSTCYISAEILYNAGYRKQEWISVDERLPEMYEDVLYFNGHSIGVDFICSDGTWCDEEVHNKPITHWLPLPEAPKMKGGAE